MIIISIIFPAHTKEYYNSEKYAIISIVVHENVTLFDGTSLVFHNLCRSMLFNIMPRYFKTSWMPVEKATVRSGPPKPKEVDVDSWDFSKNQTQETRLLRTTSRLAGRLVHDLVIGSLDLIRLEFCQICLSICKKILMNIVLVERQQKRN